MYNAFCLMSLMAYIYILVQILKYITVNVFAPISAESIINAA